MSHLIEQIKIFLEDILDYLWHSNRLIEVPNTLTDLVEAIIGVFFYIISIFLIVIVYKIFKGLI
jgi:hypothetical protein